jgi:hypothetical protein
VVLLVSVILFLAASVAVSGRDPIPLPARKLSRINGLQAGSASKIFITKGLRLDSPSHKDLSVGCLKRVDPVLVRIRTCYKSIELEGGNAPRSGDLFFVEEEGEPQN